MNWIHFLNKFLVLANLTRSALYIFLINSSGLTIGISPSVKRFLNYFFLFMARYAIKKMRSSSTQVHGRQQDLHHLCREKDISLTAHKIPTVMNTKSRCTEQRTVSSTELSLTKPTFDRILPLGRLPPPPQKKTSSWHRPTITRSINSSALYQLVSLDHKEFIQLCSSRDIGQEAAAFLQD